MEHQILPKNGIIEIASIYSVAETIDRLEILVKSKGMKIFARINQMVEAKEVGLELRPTELLIFGDPRNGTVLMNECPLLAIDLPLKALAWEDENGQVWLAYNSPLYLQKRFSLVETPFQSVSNLLETANRIKLRKIIPVVMTNFSECANLVKMNLKQAAGERAAEFVKDGMTVGLGTGSTVYWTIRRLGELVIKQKLKIRAVPTSLETENLAREFGIPLVTFADVSELDLTIDGADEISLTLDLIKGGGGALLREKLVAEASERLMIVADESKLVANLGLFPLPVEIVPFAWETTAKRVKSLNLKPTLRINKGKTFVTDNENYILDCATSGGKIENPAELYRALKLLPGVVEIGLFVQMASVAIVAGANGIKIMERQAFEKS